MKDGLEPVTATATASTPMIAVVGASAGGLDALRALFAAMAADERLAFVVIMHLPADHVSYLPELLQRAGALPAHELSAGEAVQGGRIYVTPPGHWLAIRDGTFAFDARPLDRQAAQRPIDHFMRSLAQDAGPRSIGIVLSGTDHDGTAGLKAIQEAGGFTLAQTPDTAQFPGMPQSAMSAGVAGEVMAPAAMVAALSAHVERPSGQARVAVVDASGEQDGAADRDPDHPGAGTLDAAAEDDAQGLFNDVLELVRERIGHDFQWYRTGMLRRRLRRRMILHRCRHLSDYLDILRDSPDEIAALAQQFLIGVTEFFRDAPAWDELAGAALPALLAQRGADDLPLRVWTPGCSTGEESYSIAMLLIEALERRGLEPAVQVFATDIDLMALEFARRGVYSSSIEKAVSPARLARFFERRGEGYAIRKPLRDCVIFAPQNLVRDTPFSRLDLVLCRNVLMYFEPALQDQVVQVFHFALKPGGLLWLGRAESLTGHAGIFEAVSSPSRLYRRIGGRAYLPRGFSGPRGGPTAWIRRLPERPPPAAEVVRQHLGEREVDAAVLVDAEGRALFFQGDTARFLAPQGEATQELLRLVRSELRPWVRILLRQAQTEGAVESRLASLPDGAGARPVRLRVEPVSSREGRTAYVVTFALAHAPTSPSVPVPAPPNGDDGGDLEASRRELALALEDAERSNDELRLTSEEASSLNEELQSSNEELESSKEELQSLNEELATVNAQLEDKVVEVARHADDLSNLLESTQIATILLDRALRIRRFTPAAAMLFGLRPGDEGRMLSDFASRVADADFADAAQRCVDGAAISQAEVAGPQRRTYLRRLQPFLTDAKAVDGAVATFVDITALRDAARRLRELMSVLRDSNDAVIGMDADGRILSWNRGAEQIYGHGAEQAMALSLLDLVPPAQHDDTRRMLRQALDGGTVGPVDAARLGRDGRVVQASVVVSALRDGGGDAPTLLSTERDITERRRIESEIRFRRLADDIPALLRVEDRHGMAQFVNRACCEYTGASAEAMLAHGWLEHVVPEDRQRYLDERAQAHPARRRLEIDIRLRRHDGVARWFRSISVPHLDADGRFAGYVALMLDIEDRKTAETELLVSGRRKDEFLAMLAHELRNPLAPVLNASKVLGRPGATSQTIAWAVGIIERQTQTMSKLLDSLLDVARIARGKTVLELAPLELRVILDRSIELSQAAIESKQQSLTVRQPEGALLIEGDLVRLTQVFANLLNNASKYTDEGGRIDVTAEVISDDVVVRVTDTGAGIAPEMLPRVFDLFSQADRTLDRAKGGLGLGLTLVRQLVGLHHGEVSAESPGLGLGSTFRVRLPLLEVHPRHADVVHPGASIPAGAPESRRVLVVDDNVDAARSLAALLGTYGHPVRVAEDGPSALAMVEQQTPDVVILDVGLPGMDGYQVARALRGRTASADITILALTGYGQLEDVAAARDAGCDQHFVKPANVDALTERIAQAPKRGD